MHNCKNYSTQGGDKLVIGGEIEVLDGATIIGITGVVAAASARRYRRNKSCY